MGSCVSSKRFKPTPGHEDLNILAKETTFSVNEVEALYELYKKISYSIIKDGLIHKEEFLLALFRNRNKNNLFADRIFDLFDLKRNGVIEFGEFVRSLNIFHPDTPTAEKIASRPHPTVGLYRFGEALRSIYFWIVCLCGCKMERMHGLRVGEEILVLQCHRWSNFQNGVRFGLSVGVSLMVALLPAVAFRLYDLRGTGSIEREELKELVLALLNESDLVLSDEAVEQIVDQTFKQADANGDGKIDPEEWKDFACKNPALLKNMTLPYLKDITMAFPSFVLKAGASDDEL